METARAKITIFQRKAKQPETMGLVSLQSCLRASATLCV